MNENKKSVSIPCKWCKRPMPPVEEFMSEVCLDCYRLLHNARISDEEIFAGQERNLSKPEADAFN